MPALRLSVVIPVHNGAGWIGGCLEAVGTAAETASLSGVEFVVVDDGSTDATVVEAEAAVRPISSTLVVLTQPNSGRLAARAAGLSAAEGEMVLFIDTRVRLDPGALAFVFPLLERPEDQVWTAHTVANTDLSPIAGFWQAIEHVAWRRYWRRPSRTWFGIDEFDYYPKGTTALLAPRHVLLDAFDAYEPTVDDQHISNDDTAVLRWVAERYGLNIAPGYSCVYNSRTTLRDFLQHARHRGAVLIDGYLRPGARFSRAIVVVLAASPLGAVAVIRAPRLVVPAAGLASVGAGLGVLAGGARPRDSVVVSVLAVPFGVFYLAGMWRGAFARLRSLRSSPARTVG